MTPRQLEIIQHALGADKYGKPNCPNSSPHTDYYPYYRNHFCAGGKDEEVCKELVALGFMQQHQTTEMLPYFNCSVTKKGIQAMREHSPVAPKVSRDKQRYQEFLNAADAFGCTFKEWLAMRKTQWYKDMKEGKSPASVLEDYLK